MATTGAKSSIGTSAVLLTATSTPLTYGVGIKAAAANGGTVYVGFTSGVTANSADATDGYQLSAGDEVFIPKTITSNANTIYLIGSGAGQKVFYLAL